MGKIEKKRSLLIFIVVVSSLFAETRKISLFNESKQNFGWRIGLGWEFPGAQGSLNIDNEMVLNGKPSLKLYGDFSKGGKYVEAGLRIDPPLDIDKISFWIKFPEREVLTMRIVDSSGQCHQIRLKIKNTQDWQYIEFPLKDFFEKRGTPQAVKGVAGYQYWSGKKDGKLYPPCKWISFLASPAGEKKEVILYLNSVEVELVQKKKEIIKKIERILISSERLGNLFYPGDKIKFNVTVETKMPLEEDEKIFIAEIRDYWQILQFQPIKFKLENSYKAQIDLTNFKFEIGKYYEVHIIQEGGEKYHEFTTFAILPEPVTKKYRPEEIPFTQRNWDNRIKEYFYLSDRLGIRICGIWSSWAPDPPYDSSAPGIEIVKSLDMKWLGGAPSGTWEHHRGRWNEYDEKDLKEGAKEFVKKYSSQNLLYLSLGNEPPPNFEKAKECIPAYKAVYEGVKEVNPDIIVIGTSVGPEENYFKAGFQNYQDMYDFHSYEDYRRLYEIFRKYKELFQKYGGEKPICSTELGLNSQGMERIDVAKDLIKKFTVFFALGGAHASWFDILYPDPKGEIGDGSAGQSHNVFFCKYSLYCPKLDAIAYYNIVNGICVKKFIESKIYKDGTEIYLFRDKEGNSLISIWNEKERKEIFIPLSEVNEVEVIRIDGSKRKLNAQGRGISIDVSSEPVLLLFNQKKGGLPVDIKESDIKILYSKSVVEGGNAEIMISGKGISPENINLNLPYEWKILKMEKVKGGVKININVPSEIFSTEARIRITVSGNRLNGDFFVPLSIVNKIEAKVLPSIQDNLPAVKIIFKNNGTQVQKIGWEIYFDKEFSMQNGTFNFKEGITPTASFKKSSKGEIILSPKEEKEIILPIEKIEPLKIYRIGFVYENEGRVNKIERLMGGFLGVPKLKGKIKIDGNLSENDWIKAPAGKIEDSFQYWQLNKSVEGWKGKDDLSGIIKFLWDENYLYIGAEVIDDVFCVTTQDSAIWAQDGLQFLFDPARGEIEKKGKYDYSVALGKKGPQAWCHLSPEAGIAPSGEVKEILVGIKVDKLEKGNKITYEIAIPWKRLFPFKPYAGNNLGVGVIINEDDGPGRDGFMGWFSGVHTKELDCVGDLILIK